MTKITRAFVLAIIISALSYRSIAANCANGTTYPIYVFEGPEHSLNTPFNPASAITVLNGISGWFGCGSIGDISMSGFYSHAKNCNDGEEYWYKYEESSGSLAVTPSASAGPSFGGIINNIKGAIEGLGIAPDALQAILDTMNAPAATISFSYNGNVSKVYQLDEANCPSDGWYTCPYLGQESYNLSGSIMSFENDDVMFDIGNANCSYVKIGYTTDNSWTTYYNTSSSIVSRSRVGVDGQVDVDVHVYHAPRGGTLANGEWCETSLVSE